MTLDDALAEAPLVAILRGITPDEVEAHGQVLHGAGVRIVEIPLNSPNPLSSLKRLKDGFGDRLVCGSGTVLSAGQVADVADAGGQIVVSPNTNPEVIAATRTRGLEPLPGFQTASEAFTAYAAGARLLKLFPADSLGPPHLGALMAVLPADVRVFAVGGAGPATMEAWWSAGARGFGLGSDLYRPGQSPQETGRRAAAAMAALRPLLRP